MAGRIDVGTRVRIGRVLEPELMGKTGVVAGKGKPELWSGALRYPERRIGTPREIVYWTVRLDETGKEEDIPRDHLTVVDE